MKTDDNVNDIFNLAIKLEEAGTCLIVLECIKEKKILGMNSEEILSTFYENIQYKKINLDGSIKLTYLFLRLKY